MKLEEIRARIEREIRHNPDIKAHRDEIADRINDQMNRLLASERWSFRQRHRLMRLYAKITLTSAQYTSNPTVNGAANTLAITFTEPTTWDFFDRNFLAGATATFTTWTNTASDGKFIIEEAGLSGSDTFIILDPTYQGHAMLSGNETLTIEWFRYLLPEDCAEPYGVMARTTDDGHWHELSLSQESALMLNEDDDPGTPKYWMTAPNFPRPYRQWDTSYYPNDGIEAPASAPVLAEAASGSLTLLATYEYCYCWEYAGQMSPMSPTAQITLTGSNRTVNLSAMASTDTVSGGRRGRNRILFRRELTSGEGPWYKIDTITDSTATTASDDGTASLVHALTTVRRHRYMPDGRREWIRFYPLTDTDIEVELRYLSRVRQLEAPADTPDFPPEFHQILVHLVVRDYAMSVGARSLADHHSRQAEELTNEMASRYIVRSSTRYQRHTMLRRGRTGYLVATPSYTSDA